MMRLALLTPAEDYHVDWRPDAANYQRLFGDSLSLRAWRCPGDLNGFDLVMPLLAWGYQRDPVFWYDQLDAWQGLPFANTLETLRWNTNKTYLLELEACGVPIVPSRLATALCPQDLETARALFGDVSLVVKPTISGGAEGTYRLEPGDQVPAEIDQREMLIQPLVAAIAEEGEYSLFYFGGKFSHAVLKRPAAGDFRVQEQFGGTEMAINPPATAEALANAALGAMQTQLLYARVDMVRGRDGSFRLMELELIEPALFLSQAPDHGAMFADVVRQQVEKNRSG